MQGRENFESTVKCRNMAGKAPVHLPVSQESLAFLLSVSGMIPAPVAQKHGCVTFHVSIHGYRGKRGIGEGKTRGRRGEERDRWMEMDGEKDQKGEGEKESLREFERPRDQRGQFDTLSSLINASTTSSRPAPAAT